MFVANCNVAVTRGIDEQLFLAQRYRQFSVVAQCLHATTSNLMRVVLVVVRDEINSRCPLA